MNRFNHQDGSEVLTKMLQFKKNTSGNKVEFFFNGEGAFKDMWSSIQNAKYRVWTETYQLTPDPVGLRMIQELADAAKRGCHVVLVYDCVGSYLIRDNHLEPLVKAGGIVIPYHDIISRLLKFQMPIIGRNHRKILIVDHTVAYTGGVNMSSDYAGVEVGGNGRFRDTHCSVRGPAITHLVNVFLNSVKTTSKKDWKGLVMWCRQKQPQKQEIKRYNDDGGGGVFLQVLHSNVSLLQRDVQKSIILSILGAKRYCYITTPYFIPPLHLEHAIILAKAKGVDVRLITQGLCRTPLIGLASQQIYGRFLKQGVRIYQLQTQELHAKTIIVDGYWSIIGTFNFDELSFGSNLEVNLNMLDPNVSSKLLRQFQVDLSNSVEITLDSWYERSLLNRMQSWLALTMFQCFLGAKDMNTKILERLVDLEHGRGMTMMKNKLMNITHQNPIKKYRRLNNNKIYDEDIFNTDVESEITTEDYKKTIEEKIKKSEDNNDSKALKS
eukprot:TRINITY_DN3512_c0_g1_i1.p1 TRINITY_DN3512_c0_g1~~TRINITY_DN3512_c0_g1_i1.p1  ORF type:complete len:495 (+),score=83.33 TRINITY_DN3512_c0_g1_i1:287-1771(+)